MYPLFSSLESKKFKSFNFGTRRICGINERISPFQRPSQLKHFELLAMSRNRLGQPHSLKDGDMFREVLAKLATLLLKFGTEHSSELHYPIEHQAHRIDSPIAIADSRSHFGGTMKEK